MLRGINYDVGTQFRKGEPSRPDFDVAVIKKEIKIIRNELNCDAIRISGEDIDRLYRASAFALEEGLQVWFSPAYIDATTKNASDYLLECARAAEKLREIYHNIIFVVGCEYSLFLKGFVRGETIYGRMENMFSPWSIFLNMIGLKRGLHKKLNSFLRDTTNKIKEIFKGEITYASGTWEKIEWDLFDYIGIDHYRAAYNKNFYTQELKGYYKFNKPVTVLEFGCCAYRGAEEKGPMGWAITEFVNGKRVIKANPPIRDESVQATYITEVLDILTKEKMHGAFVFTFINPMYPYNSEPALDLDLASYGILKAGAGYSFKDLPWAPKEAFYKLAAYYAEADKAGKLPTG